MGLPKQQKAGLGFKSWQALNILASVRELFENVGKEMNKIVKNKFCRAS